MSVGDWEALLLAALEESVRLHLRSDVPVGAWLSSGIDSSTVVALARRLAGRPLPTFTLVFDGGGRQELTSRRTLDRFPGHEGPNERVLCDRSAFRLYPTALWHAENLTPGGLDVATLVLSRASASQVTVVLTGEGSDELLGGYPWFKLDRLLRPLGRLPPGLRRLAARAPVPDEWKPRSRGLIAAPSAMTMGRYRHLVGPRYPDAARRMLSGEVRARLGPGAGDGEDDAEPLPGAVSCRHPLEQLQYREMTVRLPNFVLDRLDHIAMAVGLEARVPFLDDAVIDLCLRMPPSLKLRGLTEKYVLRRAVRRLLPPEVVRRRKWGLQAPYRRWLREAPPPFVDDLLSPGRIREKGYLEPGVVSTMRARHRAGIDLYGEAIMGALAIQLLDEIFVRGRGPFTG
jgi:asparagine synthase (glutamine-hydrolysing)